jgi:hypothetical protein
MLQASASYRNSCLTPHEIGKRPDNVSAGWRRGHHGCGWPRGRTGCISSHLRHFERHEAAFRDRRRGGKGRRQGGPRCCLGPDPPPELVVVEEGLQYGGPLYYVLGDVSIPLPFYPERTAKHAFKRDGAETLETITSKRSELYDYRCLFDSWNAIEPSSS